MHAKAITKLSRRSDACEELCACGMSVQKCGVGAKMHLGAASHHCWLLGIGVKGQKMREMKDFEAWMQRQSQRRHADLNITTFDWTCQGLE